MKRTDHHLFLNSGSVLYSLPQPPKLSFYDFKNVKNQNRNHKPKALMGEFKSPPSFSVKADNASFELLLQSIYIFYSLIVNKNKNELSVF